MQAAREATGLSLEQLLTVPEVQRMTRTRQDGERVPAVRVPSELLDAAALDPARVGAAVTDYGVHNLSEAEFRTRLREIIDAGKPAA